MSVYQPRGTKRYVYEFQIGNKKFRGPCGTTDRAEAVRVERKARAGIEAGQRPDAASEMTIDAACGLWFEEVGRHQPSAQNWKRSLDLIVDCVGERTRLKEITTATVAEAVRLRKLLPVEFRNKAGKITHSRKAKASTVNRQVVDLLRRILRRAVIVWGAKSLPAINWREVRETEAAPREREISDDERDRLHGAIRSAYWGDFWNFLSTYGLRFGEMFFKPGDVYEVDGQVSIRIKDRKDGSNYVVVLLPEDGRLMLARKSRAQAAGFDVCWYSEWRGRLRPLSESGARSALRRLIKRAGVSDLTIHDHRHDAATKLTREAGIAIAQAQLGHADISTTRRYVKVSAKDRLDALSRVKSREKRRDDVSNTENNGLNQAGEL